MKNPGSIISFSAHAGSSQIYAKTVATHIGCFRNTLAFTQVDKIEWKIRWIFNSRK
jgi:hypothetical protein